MTGFVVQGHIYGESDRNHALRVTQLTHSSLLTFNSLITLLYKGIFSAHAGINQCTKKCPTATDLKRNDQQSSDHNRDVSNTVSGSKDFWVTIAILS